VANHEPVKWGLPLYVALAAVALAAAPAPASAAQAQQAEVGTTFPEGFDVPTDAHLQTPVIGFGSAEGSVTRTPVIFLHGNNDTPYPTTCNGAFGYIHNMAQHFADHGYSPRELWGLGYQGEQCDLLTAPANKSGEGHSTVANVPDLRAFVDAVLDFTGASQVDIVGHSLGGTLTREWLRQDNAYAKVRRVVAVDAPNHGIINCSPDPQNYFQPDAAGGFTPDSAICQEYGSDHTPLLSVLNAGDETPGPTQWMTVVNGDVSFVFVDEQDGVFPPCPAQDNEGNPHDFSKSAHLAGAQQTIELTGQGQYDPALLTAHLGIINSPETWEAALGFLSAPEGNVSAGPPAPAGPMGPSGEQNNAVESARLAATGPGATPLVPAMLALVIALTVRRSTRTTRTIRTTRRSSHA
jgi:pimeloyl-ACP methyl ester carboxylesterase